MASTERGGPTDDDSAGTDASTAEPDTTDGKPGKTGLLAGVRERFSRGDDAEVDETNEGSSGLLSRLSDAVGDESEDEGAEPTRAELVDGANVLFIDPAAASKSLSEFRLVLITAPQYPEPIVLKNDSQLHIPEGSVLCSSQSASILDLGGKRVIGRPYILVPPDRADEVSPDYREPVPEAIAGKTVPGREVQDEEFYQLVLSGVQASQ